jgi:hypothetical protein
MLGTLPTSIVRDCPLRAHERSFHNRSLREQPKTTRPNGAAAPKRAARRGKSQLMGSSSAGSPIFQLQIGTTPISQIVRFALPNIQFYDRHIIDLYQLICAPYLIA